MNNVQWHAIARCFRTLEHRSNLIFKIRLLRDPSFRWDMVYPVPRYGIRNDCFCDITKLEKEKLLNLKFSSFS